MQSPPAPAVQPSAPHSKAVLSPTCMNAANDDGNLWGCWAGRSINMYAAIADLSAVLPTNEAQSGVHFEAAVPQQCLSMPKVIVHKMIMPAMIVDIQSYLSAYLQVSASGGGDSLQLANDSWCRVAGCCVEL